MTPDALGDESVRALAREVLARPEYARFRAPEAAWWDQLKRTLGDFFGWLDALWATSPFLYVLLLGGLVALAAALLAHLVWAVRRALSVPPPPAPARRGADAPDLAGEALALARAERFLEAAHAMQLACLAELMAKGALDLRRHEPNRTLRRRILQGRLPEAERRDFVDLLGRLEGRWFRERGSEPGDRDLFAAWRDLHARLATTAQAT